MLYSTPVAQVAVVGHSNQPILSPKASVASTKLVKDMLLRHQAELRLSGELVIPDSLQKQAKQEIYRAVEGLEKRHRLDTGAHLPILDGLLAVQNQRYVMVSATEGFTRTDANYGQQLAISIGVGLLTGGMMIPVSTKANSIICLFIYDHQQKVVVYYNHTPPFATGEPLNPEVVEKQIRRMLTKDFLLR